MTTLSADLNDTAIGGGNPLAAAQRIATVLIDNAEAGERLGRLTDASVAALLEERLFSLKVPSRWGGHDADYLTTVQVIEEVSRADSSAGWCLSVCNSNSAAIAASLSPEALDEIFFDHGRVAIAGALQPRGTSIPVEGGARFSGQFGWGSGSSLSSWYMAGAPVQEPDGSVAIRMHVLPIDACQLQGNWQVAGLEATCSQDLTIDDVFVASHHIFDVNVSGSSFASQYAGADGSTKGDTSTPTGMSIQESTVVGLTGVAAWSLGVARRALDELESTAQTAKRLLSPGKVAEDFHVQIGLSHAEGRLRSARGHLFGLLTEMHEAAAAGGVSESLRVAVFETSLEATAAARAAVLFAYDSAPTSVVYRHSPIQRCVRDMLVGLKHAAVSTSMQSRVGMARLGLPDHGL